MERLLLAGLDLGRAPRSHAEASLAELRRLTETAGAVIAGETIVTLRHINPATYLTSGKVEELKAWAAENEADGLVFDGELSATHQRNLEEAIGLRVIDRTMVILDIFAKRARSKEGKIQVEAAQLRYRLPRLKGQGTSLSRLGGGIGTRGPGETKLEVDRRRTLERLSRLEKELEEVARTRETQRKKRERNAMPAIVIIGYTNAGKSTLLNALAHSDIYAADQLFATLDPTTRVAPLPGGIKAAVTDTVGFIHHLPTSLINAFHATLEEIARADLLIQLADASSPQAARELEATEQVLRELEALEVPRILAWNKADLLKIRRDEIAPAGEGPYGEKGELGAREGSDGMNGSDGRIEKNGRNGIAREAKGAIAGEGERSSGDAMAEEGKPSGKNAIAREEILMGKNGIAGEEEPGGGNVNAGEEKSAVVDDDWMSAPPSPEAALPHTELPSLRISARSGEGLPALLALAAQMLAEGMQSASFRVPLSRGDLLSRVRELSRVERIVWRPEYAEIQCSVPRSAWETFQREILSAIQEKQ